MLVTVSWKEVWRSRRVLSAQSFFCEMRGHAGCRYGEGGRELRSGAILAGHSVVDEKRRVENDSGRGKELLMGNGGRGERCELEWTGRGLRRSAHGLGGRFWGDCECFSEGRRTVEQVVLHGALAAML